MAAIAAGGTSNPTVPDVAVSEWNTRIAGTVESCGQASANVLLYLYGKLPLSQATVTQLSQETVAARQVTDYPHASTSPSNLIWLCNRHGLSTSNVGSGGAVISAIRAGRLPMVVGVSHASALGGSDQGINGHYVCVLHVNGDGSYTVADPNQRAALQGRPVTYTLAQLSNAQPFCGIVAGSGAGVQPGAGGTNAGSSTSSSGSPGVTALIPGAGAFIGVTQDAAAAYVNGHKQLLEQVPGVAGICYALDSAQQIPGVVNEFTWSNPIGSAVGTVLTTIFDNGAGIISRGVVAGLGLFLVGALLLALAKENAASLAPLAMTAAEVAG